MLAMQASIPEVWVWASVPRGPECVCSIYDHQGKALYSLSLLACFSSTTASCRGIAPTAQGGCIGSEEVVTKIFLEHAGM